MGQTLDQPYVTYRGPPRREPECFATQSPAKRTSFVEVVKVARQETKVVTQAGLLPISTGRSIASYSP